MKLNFDTLIIFVQDVDKLKTFYADILQLDVLEEIPSQWLLLKAGHANIGLHRIGAAYLDENAPPFKFDNNTKLVFEVTEDLSALRTRLLAQQVTLKAITTWDGADYWCCDGEDPEGNIFQLKQKKQQS